MSDLTAHRLGNTVQLQFTVPWRSTDKLPLPGDAVLGTLCRQTGRGPCTTPAGFASRVAISILDRSGHRNSVTWSDTLPPELTSENPQILAYRVEFFSAAGHSAGPSDAAYSATGAAPTPVTGLRIEGSRLGAVLHWNPPIASGAETLIRRESSDPISSETPTSAVTAPTPPATPSKAKSRHPATPRSVKQVDSAVWLTANSSADQNSLLDTGIQLETPYRYSATRRIELQLGGRSIEVRSSESPPIAFTFRPIYPPEAPTGLTAAGFRQDSVAQASNPSPTFAVDLIWQPVDASGLLVPLAGYNIFRQTIGPAGQSIGDRQLQNPTPVPLPAFHDATALPTQRYTYSITAVDTRGNQSSFVSVVVEPAAVP